MRKKKEWLDATEILGRVARVKAGMDVAQKARYQENTNSPTPKAVFG